MAERSIILDILARDRASGVLSKVGKSAETFGGKVKGELKKALNPATIFAGTAGIAAFGVTSVKAAADAQTSQKRLSDAFAKFPQLAGSNADGLRKINTELQRKTKFEDDATASAQAQLAGFGLTADQLKTITPLLQDYASRTGKDLPSAAQDLGKAILGQGRALKGIGINFKNTGSEAGNFGELVDGLKSKVGGFAAREGTTAAGKLEIMRNQFQDLQEKVGGALLPVLSKLADFMATKLIPAISKIIDFVGKNKALFIALAIGITAALLPALYAAAIAALAAAAGFVALNLPLILFGAAVAAVALLVIKNWGTIKAAFSAALDFIKGVVAGAIDFIKGHWQLLLAILVGPFGVAVYVIKGHFQAIVDFVKKIPGWIVAAFKGVANLITAPYRAAFNAIAHLWNSTIGKLHFKIPGWVPGVGGKGFDVPNIPEVKALALGGIVTRPTLALVGEAGPEAVVPLNGRHGFGGVAWHGDINVDARGIEPAPAVGEYVSRFVGWKLSLVGGD